MLLVHDKESALFISKGQNLCRFDTKDAVMVPDVWVLWISFNYLALTILPYDVVNEAFLILDERNVLPDSLTMLTHLPIII